MSVSIPRYSDSKRHHGMELTEQHFIRSQRAFVKDLLAQANWTSTIVTTSSIVFGMVSAFLILIHLPAVATVKVKAKPLKLSIVSTDAPQLIFIAVFNYFTDEAMPSQVNIHFSIEAISTLACHLPHYLFLHPHSRKLSGHHYFAVCFRAILRGSAPI